MTATDYLYYQTQVKVSNPGPVTLRINLTDANVVLAFVDGKLQSSTYNNEHKFNNFNVTYSLRLTINDTNSHNLTLLSVNLGTDNGIPPGSFDSKGIVNGVSLGTEDITKNLWLHRPKLEGEKYSRPKDQVWDQEITMYVDKSVVWFQVPGCISRELRWRVVIPCCWVLLEWDEDTSSSVAFL